MWNVPWVLPHCRWEKVLRARVSKQPRVIPAYCAHLGFADHRSLVLNSRGQRTERNFSPWQLFLKSSLRGTPLILLVSRAERATLPCFYRNRRKRCSRVWRSLCRARNNTLPPHFLPFFSFTLFIHSKFGILMDTFCKLQFFKVIRFFLTMKSRFPEELELLEFSQKVKYVGKELSTNFHRDVRKIGENNWLKRWDYQSNILRIKKIEHFFSLLAVNMGWAAFVNVFSVYVMTKGGRQISLYSTWMPDLTGIATRLKSNFHMHFVLEKKKVVIQMSLHIVMKKKKIKLTSSFVCVEFVCSTGISNLWVFQLPTLQTHAHCGF